MLITMISKKSDIVQKMCIIWELTQNRKRFFKGKSTSGPLQVLKDTSDQIQESENWLLISATPPRQLFNLRQNLCSVLSPFPFLPPLLLPLHQPLVAFHFFHHPWIDLSATLLWCIFYFTTNISSPSFAGLAIRNREL